MNLRDHLEGYRAPGEEEARERGWEVVRAAFDEREPAAPRRAPLRPLALMAAGAAVVALAVTPAGAAVTDWIGDVVQREKRVVGPPALEVPGGGRILVETDAGPWVVAADGARRLLGEYADATWSPGGLFLAVTADRELLAIEPNGRVRWQLTAPGLVRSPQWAPSGFRIAYLSGDSLRVVAGDGTGDRVLADRAAGTPAWRPTARHVLAFSDADGRVSVVDTDTRKALWAAPGRGEPVDLAWSSDGRRLLARGRREIRMLGRDGRVLATIAGTSRGDAAFRPGSHAFALVERQPGGGHRVVLQRAEEGRGRARTLFAGPGRIGGIAWSPDGRRLLIAWNGSDQWLFVSADGRRVRSFDRIAERFDAGRPDGPQVPRLAGWVR